MDEYSKKIFKLSFQNLKDKLIKYDEENSSQKNSISGFIWLFYNQEHNDSSKVINEIKLKIGKTGGILSKLFQN